MAILTRRHLSRSLLLAAGAVCLLPALVATAETALSEYEVKAAYLYNFVKFVSWPAEAFPDDGSPFVIGVVGGDPFEGKLERMVQGKLVNNRRLQIRQSSRAEDLRGCHIVFVPHTENSRAGALLDALNGLSVLTVGDDESFAPRGGVIGFVREGERVSFEINLEAAERSRLTVSSKLLKVAVRLIHPGRKR
jgi:hypothetical protein